jgi:Ty3 transposon capsid-like protein/Zinc knuckle
MSSDQSTSTPTGFDTPLATEPFRMALKAHLPSKYAGQRDFNIIEAWICAVNSYFILSRAQPPFIYYVLSTFLEGDAAVWYRYHFPETSAAQVTWDVVRESLRNYFAPVNKLKKLHDDWNAIRQTTTVMEYSTRFSSLAMELAHNKEAIPQQMLIDHFVRGLKPQTRLELELKEPASLNEAIQIADRYDQISFNKFKKSYGYYENSVRSPFGIPRYESGGEPMQIDALEINAARTSKPLKKPQQFQKLSIEERTHLQKIGACFKCRQPGHMARQCPATGKQTSFPRKNSTRQ